jgi:ankyrin repeat protein
MLSVFGHSVANSILLEKPCPIEVNPRMADSLRNSFIAKKYQTLEWANRENIPDPFEAIRNGDFISLFRAMNLNKADVKKNSLTPLHAAVQSGDPLLATIACCCVTNVDPLDDNGWTPLCHAIFYGFNEIARFLLSVGAHPEACKIDLLSLAVWNGDPDVIEPVLAAQKVEAKGEEYFPISGGFTAGSAALREKVVISDKVRDSVRMYWNAFRIEAA